MLGGTKSILCADDEPVNLKLLEAVLVPLGYEVHDVGKIHIPPDILKKPGRLTPEEWKEIKMHTVYGKKIIGEHLRLRMAGDISIAHHERWDGSGYPFGLKGDQIPSKEGLSPLPTSMTPSGTSGSTNLHSTTKPHA